MDEATQERVARLNQAFNVDELLAAWEAKEAAREATIPVLVRLIRDLLNLRGRSFGEPGVAYPRARELEFTSLNDPTGWVGYAQKSVVVDYCNKFKPFPRLLDRHGTICRRCGYWPDDSIHDAK